MDLNRLWTKVSEKLGIGVAARVEEHGKYRTTWTVRKYVDDAAFAAGRSFATDVIEGNLLLNEGITRLLNLLIGGGGTVFSNANAFIGVGDSTTAESASQTGLSASTNKLYKAMQSGYPQISAQTVTFRAQFTGSEANFAWNEFTVSNGNSDASENLNRKVAPNGTKANGQTWTVDVAITWS